MSAGASEYPFGWGAVGMAMSADEALNGMSAAPAYYGAYPAGPGAGQVGTASGAASTTSVTKPSGMGMPGLLIWGFVFVAVILSHTFTFELQE